MLLTDTVVCLGSASANIVGDHSGWEIGGDCWHSTGKRALQNYAGFEETDTRSGMSE